MAVIYHDKSTKTLRVTTATGNHLDVLRGDNDTQAKLEATKHLVFNANHASGNLQWELNGTEEMRLTTQGAGSQAALVIGDIYASAFTADAKLVLQTDGDCGLHIIADDDNLGGEGDNPLIKLSQDGGTKQHLIGMAGVAGSFFTGSLADASYVHGAGGTFQIATAGDVAMTVDASQDIVMAGDLSCVALTETSDARLKEEVTDLDMGVDYINSLRPVSYKRKDDDSDKRHLGLIAQEVGPVTPDSSIVHYSESTDEYSLAYTQLIAPLIKSVQELSARVKELEGGQDE